MRTAKEPQPAEGRRPAKSRYRNAKVALAVTAAPLLAAGFMTTSARADVIPDALRTCTVGANSTYEYHGWCQGSGPTSYRAIAFCTAAGAPAGSQGEGVYGLERWDGDSRQSYANCHHVSSTERLTEDWGYLLCSNNNGTGSYQGYVTRHGNISWILLNLGGGPTVPNAIQNGGTALCDWDLGEENWFNPYNPL